MAIYADAVARQLGVAPGEVHARARAVFARMLDSLVVATRRRRGLPSPMSGARRRPRRPPGVPPAVAAEIRRHGAVPLDRVLERALYDPATGFYETGGRAGGPAGDFLTSPEVGRAVRRRGGPGARRAGGGTLGAPDPFVVVEAGAGPGTLARTVLAAAPDVRRRPALRARRAVGGPARACTPSSCRLEDPALGLRPGRPRHRVAGRPARPRARSASAWPSCPASPGRRSSWPTSCSTTCPFGLAERRDGGWCEVRADLGHGRRRRSSAWSSAWSRWTPTGPPCSTAWRPTPPPAPGSRCRTRPGPGCATRWRSPARGAGSWSSTTRPTTAELAARPQAEWLRTYRAHARGGGAARRPRAPGRHVRGGGRPARPGPPAVVRRRTQADWLRAHGIDELVAAARATWAERAHLGDLAALAARSRVTEAEALLDPAGLGGFRVLEWA